MIDRSSMLRPGNSLAQEDVLHLPRLAIMSVSSLRLDRVVG